jgi:hypothetical protein
MSEFARSMHFSVRARMIARASARARRERRRNTTARPLDVYHPVGMYLCECVYVHMAYVCTCRFHASVCACAYVRARTHREWHTRRVHIYVYV